MKIKSFLFTVICLITVVACHKHHDEDDATAPALNLENPAEGASLAGEVHVFGKVTDESLHEMEIKVTKDSDGVEILKANPDVHDKTEYSFDQHFTPSVGAETAVTLTITVFDHNDNTTVKTVKFSVKP